MNTGKPSSPAQVQRLVGRIPRCPGFKYGAKIKAIPYNGTYLFRVEQKGFWMDSYLEGPAKTTSEEAVKAWKRLLKARFHMVKTKRTCGFYHQCTKDYPDAKA